MKTTDKVPFVAILRGITPHEIEQHVKVLVEAGFPMIEIPLNSPDWAKSIRLAVTLYGSQAIIGAGTVLNTNQVDQLAETGCRLIVTPNTVVSVIQRARQHGMTVIPGCATATEAFTAIDAGAESLKIFPSSAFGPDYISALRTVIPPHINLLAVGGVSPENLHQYMHAGCSGIGLGSALYQAGQSPEKTRLRADAFIASYKKMASTNT